MLDMTEREALRWLKDYAKSAHFSMPQYEDALAVAIDLLEQRSEPGHWIADEVQLPDRVVLNYHCSVCGRKLVGYSTETLKDAPFCHCGAKMEVSEW